MGEVLVDLICLLDAVNTVALYYLLNGVGSESSLMVFRAYVVNPPRVGLLNTVSVLLQELSGLIRSIEVLLFETSRS